MPDVRTAGAIISSKDAVSRLVVELNNVDSIEIVLHGGVFSPRNMEDLMPITNHQIPSGERCLEQTLQPLLGCYDTDLLPRRIAQHHHSVTANPGREHAGFDDSYVTRKPYLWRYLQISDTFEKATWETFSIAHGVSSFE
jgi:hypothetical protein